MRRFFCLLLCLFLLGSLCFAEEKVDPLTTKIQEFMEENSLNEENFSFCFYNISTKETCSFHEDQLFPVGDLWTLPLNLYYYCQEAAGAFESREFPYDQVYKIGDKTLADCHFYSILKSDMAVSRDMRDHLGSLSEYKLLLNDTLGHLPADQLTDEFLLTNNYSARFLMNCMVYLTDHPKDFPELLQNYGLVQPQEGFAAYSHVYGLTHIMGREDGTLCDVAKVNASQAYLLVAFVPDNADGSRILADLNDLICTYVDQGAGVAEEATRSANLRGDSDFVISSGNSTSHGAMLWVGLAAGGAVVLIAIVGVVVFLLRRKREENGDF